MLSLITAKIAAVGGSVASFFFKKKSPVTATPSVKMISGFEVGLLVVFAFLGLGFLKIMKEVFV